MTLDNHKENFPQPGPQEAFLASPADIVIYGGSAGGGSRFMHDVDGQYLNRAAAHAWEQIKHRSGKTVDGVFIKEDDQ